MKLRHHLVVLGFVLDFALLATICELVWFTDMNDWPGVIAGSLTALTLWSKPWTYWNFNSVHARLNNLKEMGL